VIDRSLLRLFQSQRDLDGGIAGFGIRVTAGAAKALVLTYRNDKLILPGVVSHATNVVEHPELVAERIVRFANLVGRERVIASTDCGLGGRIHPQIAWAKLEALVEGAALATRQLWR